MTNIQKLVAVLAGPAQEVEDALQQLLLQRTVDNAIGAQLDLIGKLVGQTRQGLDDDTYRRYIRARIATDNSTGKTEEFITIVQLILNDLSAVINVATQTIATAVVEVLGISVTTALATIVHSFLMDAKAAGVKLYVVYSVVAPAVTFTYDGTGAQAYDNGAYAGVI